MFPSLAMHGCVNSLRELVISDTETDTETVNALAGTHNANVKAVDDAYGKTALMRAAMYGPTDRTPHTRSVGYRHICSILT
jgi:hypothetical protein